MQSAIAATGWFIAGVIVGLFLFIGYVALRALRSEGWDDSNLLNVLRLISHVAAHPGDFAKMYYLTPMQRFNMFVRDEIPRRPFHYLGKDEFESVVDSRPNPPVVGVDIGSDSYTVSIPIDIDLRAQDVDNPVEDTQ